MRPLTIAIAASRTTIAHRTGTENYALRLIRAMLALDTPHRFLLYFRDQPSDDLFPDSMRQPPRLTRWLDRASGDKRHPVIQQVIPWRRAWTHLRFAEALWQDRPDVTFVPAHTLPLWFPGPAVVTVHDLGYVYFPTAHPGLTRRYLEWSTRHSVQRATRIIADSLTTAHDLAAHYGVSENKINLIYPGVDESLSRHTEPSKLAAMRARYGLPEHYLLFIGTLQPRKNIARIVQGYVRWRSAQKNPGVSLVVAGPKGWLYDPGWVEGVEGVTLPGYIDDDDIAALYSGALGLVFPTLYEGFGFPVLEAMRCGTPVITSSTSSLPEVAGDAAILVNPRDVDAIASAIGKLVSDDALRQNLIDKGYQQAQRFTWRQTAEQTLQVLEIAARKNRPS